MPSGGPAPSQRAVTLGLFSSPSSSPSTPSCSRCSRHLMASSHCTFLRLSSSSLWSRQSLSQNGLTSPPQPFLSPPSAPPPVQAGIQDPAEVPPTPRLCPLMKPFLVPAAGSEPPPSEQVAVYARPLSAPRASGLETCLLLYQKGASGLPLSPALYPAHRNAQKVHIQGQGGATCGPSCFGPVGQSWTLART